jgi:diamine N-acetyltransferase
MAEQESGTNLNQGRNAGLRPATLADRRAIHEWAACSDLTASMMGQPEFPEAPIPKWEQFCEDYQDYFFDGSRPEVGRSFIIEHNGEPVGHVSYSRGDELSGAETLPGAELDIWMRDSSCCGHGWGSATLRMLCEHLHQTLGMREFIMRPSARNVRAIRSYEKAGFERLTLTDAQQTAMYGPGEYHDTVTMRRVID